jgi:hypothetical protein
LNNLGIFVFSPFFLSVHLNNKQGSMSNNRISRFVVWICSKFTRSEIEFIIKELSSILKGGDPAIKPKDDIKEKQPNYRAFFVDPTAPLTEPPTKKKNRL